MNIGLVVYSYTGNTLSVVKALQAAFENSGVLSTVETVKADNEDPNAKSFNLTHKPDIKAYDTLIFASPVRGFMLSPIMAAYMNQLGSLEGKKVACVVTHHFPFPWLGGNQTISAMKKIVEAKGGKCVATGVIDWKSGKRQSQITSLCESLTDIDLWKR